MKKALGELILDKGIIVDNRMVLNVDSTYLPSKGINIFYYKIINMSLKETNDTIEKMGLDLDLSEIFEKTKSERQEGESKH